MIGIHLSLIRPSGGGSGAVPHPGDNLLLSGDMQSGTDLLLLSGDMTGGSDALVLDGTP